MRTSRILVACAAAAASAAVQSAPGAADLQEYFAIAEKLWAPQSFIAKCLAVQKREGWRRRRPPDSDFVTLGVEGSGHHWLASLPRGLCGDNKCGGLGSFSECGDCCERTVEKHRIKYAKKPNAKAPTGKGGVAWRCFAGDQPRYPKVKDLRQNVVLVRDPAAAAESVLRRFWQFDNRTGGTVDTLAREESQAAKALARLERNVLTLDCRRTLFFSYEHAVRAPRAHAAALASFLGYSPAHAGLRDALGASAANESGADRDCFERVGPWLPRLRSYAAWISAGNAPPDAGCAEARFEPVARACAYGTDDRDCARAWRGRARSCAAALRERHWLLPRTIPAAHCIWGRRAYRRS